mgnify:CR=1 FL=1
MYTDIFKEEVLDKIMTEELDIAIELAIMERDEALLAALHTVRAYYSTNGLQ